MLALLGGRKTIVLAVLGVELVLACVRDLPLASVTLTMAHWLGGGPKPQHWHGHRGRRWLFFRWVVGNRAGRLLFFQLCFVNNRQLSQKRFDLI